MVAILLMMILLMLDELPFI